MVDRDRPKPKHTHQYFRNTNQSALADGTPHAVKQRVEYNLIAALLRNLLRTTFIAIIPTVLVAGAMTGVWLSTGVRPVTEAAKDMRSAQSNWFAVLQQAHPVIDELGIHGAPVGEVEKVYFAFIDATKEERPHQADVLLQVLQDQAETLRATSEGAPRVFELLLPVTQARFEVTRTYERWLEAMRPPASRAAVILGLAPSPRESDARYAQGATRDI
ncbi:MAG TPA: hypothetical protein ENK18_04565 [Deltaproteobacteria bacterium]|nr:hypothetical protein [Deltaproteobacteria bacterium]